MAKSVYGGHNAADLDRVEDSVDMMIKSKDGGEYDCGLRYMYYILDGFDGQEIFLIRCIPSSIITFATGTPAKRHGSFTSVGILLTKATTATISTPFQFYFCP
ncbi:hypothetical protein PC116_g13501 [Phytophthora cactorum]|nr:hypothetical protein PC116_g13501 [Phytophthora cactorum]